VGGGDIEISLLGLGLGVWKVVREGFGGGAELFLIRQSLEPYDCVCGHKLNYLYSV
jgi:hypothetical protein